jgi:YVTN family beta-propeller protein
MRNFNSLLNTGLLLFTATLVAAQDKPTKNAPGFPGPTDAGFVLPNGWRVTPAGQQVILADLPLNIRTTPDGKYALAATNGYNAHELTAIELATGKKASVESVPQSWFGMAADEATGRLWWSGGGDAVVRSFAFKDGKLEPRDSYPSAAKAGETKDPTDTALTGFRTGVYYDAKAGALFSLTVLAKGGNKSLAWGDAPLEKRGGGAISRISPGQPAGDFSALCGQRPYDVVKAANGLLYVSDWADRCVLVVDPAALKTIARIPVGDHPNQLVLHPKDGRLFVACASSNAVYCVDTKLGTVQETIYTALFPQSPEGSTPDALAIDAAGDTLYVANADNNCVAVIDIEVPRKSLVKGFIPTGWYPTSLAVTPNGKQLLVGVGKGNVTGPNKPGGDRSVKGAIAASNSTTSEKRSPARSRSLMCRAKRSWPNTRIRSIAIVRTPTSSSPRRLTSERRRSQPRSARNRRSSMSSTSSRRTAPTIRCLATSRAAIATQAS